MHKRDYEVKKHKRDRILSLMRMFLTIVIVTATFFLLFSVRAIEVTGNKYIDDNTIINWASADKASGNSLVYLAKDKLGKIHRPQYVQDIKIGLKNPWTLKLTIKEKKIVAYAASGSENVYFDKDGMVVLKKKDIIENVSCIEGLDIKKADLYKKLEVSGKNTFKNIRSVTESLSDNELVPDRIVCADSDISLYFGNICVQLGNSGYTDKIGQISQVLKYLEGQEGILHLEHYGQGTSVISFEKPGEAVPAQVGDGDNQDTGTEDGQDGQDDSDSADEDQGYEDEDDEDENQDDSDSQDSAQDDSDGSDTDESDNNE